MHIDEKRKRWCIVLAAAVVALAAVGGMLNKPVPGREKLPEADATITRMPEEMPVLKDRADLKAALNQETVAEEATEAAAEGAPVHITVKADGVSMSLMTAPVTVEQLLDSYNIPVGKDDVVTPAADAVVSEDTEVVIQRISYEEIVESEVIPYETTIEGTDQLPQGTQEVKQEGVNGEDSVTYLVKYADGEEVYREETGRETVKEPVDEIILKSTVGTIKGREYSRKFTVKAYSYTGGGRTASGLPAAEGRIAVDPSVIPLGTEVYVEGYGFATAADTGGNIKGNTIDVYYNTLGECTNWGCRYITVYILK